MSHCQLAPWIAAIIGFGLTGCGESETANSLDVKIVEREDSHTLQAMGMDADSKSRL
jgi:hypothetical protein